MRQNEAEDEDNQVDVEPRMESDIHLVSRITTFSQRLQRLRDSLGCKDCYLLTYLLTWKEHVLWSTLKMFYFR